MTAGAAGGTGAGLAVAALVIALAPANAHATAMPWPSRSPTLLGRFADRLGAQHRDRHRPLRAADGLARVVLDPMLARHRCAAAGLKVAGQTPAQPL